MSDQALLICRKDSLFPCKVTGETEDGYKQQDEIEDSVCPQARNDATIFCRETDCRCDHGIQRKEEHGEDEGSWNRGNSILRPKATRRHV